MAPLKQMNVENLTRKVREKTVFANARRVRHKKTWKETVKMTQRENICHLKIEKGGGVSPNN